jgi:hypothetical protein
MDYSVVFWEVIKDDGTTWMQADMQYEKDPKVGWYLQRWTLAFPGRNLSSTNVVTRMKLNEPVDPNVFKLVFPPGTEVYDRLTGAEYVAGNQAEAPATAPQPDLQAIVAKVIAREKAVKSFEYTWDMNEMIPKMSYEALDRRTGEMTPEGPREDTIVKNVCRLMVEDSKYRFQRRGMTWFEGKGEFVPLSEDWSLVDGVWRVFHEEAAAGAISPGQQAPLVQNLVPLLRAHRLFDPATRGADPEKVRLRGRAERAGHPCVVLEQTDIVGGQYEVRHEWWLAEDEDYSVVFMEDSNQEGAIAGQDDLVYEKGPRGWQAKSWQVVSNWTANVPVTTANVVTEAKLNQPVAEDAFEVKFPPGTRVYDSFAGKEYYVTEGGENAPEEAPGETSAKAMDKFVEDVRKETAQPPKAPAAPKPAPQPVAGAHKPAAPPVQAVAALPRPLSAWLLVGGGVLVLLIVAAIALMRRLAHVAPQ